jgi:lipopolysaccharide/colanic/teichoic acid biosynthesis glycosyltransferase
MLLRHLAASGDVGAVSPSNPVPVFIELHRFVRSQDHPSVRDEIVACFARNGFPRAGRFVDHALSAGLLLLLIDGLDEVATTERARIAAAVRDGLEEHPRCAAVITCRSAVYRHELDAVVTRVLTVAPFDDAQIEDFLAAWEDLMPTGKSSRLLLSALEAQSALHTAARNPLLLTIIAHLYTDDSAYDIPQSRAGFYREAARILLSQWQSHIAANTFEPADKAEVLRRAALAVLSGQDVRDEADQRTLERASALAIAREVLSLTGQGEDRAQLLLDEITERSGLLIQLDGGDRLAFAHLTFQEYFAAEAFLDNPAGVIAHLSTDRDAWIEVAKLWSGLAPDSSALIASVADVSPLAALECLVEAHAVSLAVASPLIERAVVEVTQGSAAPSTRTAIAAIAASRRDRGEGIIHRLSTVLRDPTSPEGEIAVARTLAEVGSAEATEALVRLATDSAEARAALLGLGDVAVPELSRIAREGATLDAVALLASIGTRRAAGELATMMVQDAGVLPHAAAWGLASLLENPAILTELDLRAARGAFRGLDNTKPVQGPAEGSPSAPLVQRAAELIRNSPALSVAVAEPAWRLTFGICQAEPNPLDLPLSNLPSLPAVLESARNVLNDSNHRLESDDHGVSIGGSGNGTTRGVSKLNGLPTANATTYRELLLSVLVRAGGRAPEELDQFFATVADSVAGSDPVWSRLVGGLDVAARVRLFVTLSVAHRAMSSWQRRLKRTFDLAFAAIGLVAVAPVLLVISAAIKLDSAGPVLFRQARIGRGGRVFRMYKFRTMIADAEAARDSLRTMNEVGEIGSLFKLDLDPRITRVGLFLRRTAMDELPQLMNVLKGDMSLVGPRPRLTIEGDAVGAVGDHLLTVSPGITGAFQVAGAHASFYEMLQLDMDYVVNWSLRRDLALLLRTVLAAVRQVRS